MIDAQVKVHDKFSIEFKIGYYSSENDSTDDLAVNTWIFVPNSLDINSQTYSKGQFYRDIKSNVRLITPIFLLKDIAGGEAIPLKNLEVASHNIAQAPTRQAVNDYEYQIKMFMAILKSSLREEINHISSTPIADDVVYLCEQYIENLKASTHEYRNLRRIINIATTPAEVLNYYMFGDEFMGNIVEKYTFRLAASIQKKHGVRYSAIVEKLKDVIKEETAYHVHKGYPVVDRESRTQNREKVFRQSVLKKYIESDLFLKARRKRDGMVAEQLYLSLAAGISMIFATAIAFSFQQRYGNFTMPLFVALVVSYMLKDRIKETARYFFAHRLGSKYFDNKTLIGIKDHAIGWIKEGVDFITDNKTPREVMELRSRSPLLQAENRISDEKIILYRKLVRLDAESITTENEYKIAGINEIIRLHLDTFIKKTDNPQVPLYTIASNNELDIVLGEKVYYLNLVMQLQHNEQLTYKHYKVIFNRLGIIKLEQFK